MNSSKKAIKDIQDKIDKQFITHAAYDEFQKSYAATINEMQRRMKETEKKADIQMFLDKLNNRTKNIEDRFESLEDEIQRKFSDLMLSGLKSNAKEDPKVVVQNVDPHKLCQIENDLTRTMEQVER